MGGTVTSASRHTSHTIQLVLNVVVFAGLIIYFAYNAYKKKQHDNHHHHDGDPYQTWGPTVLLLISSLLILADPIRHVLQDHHIWHAPMYLSECPIRAPQLPERACVVSSDCGAYDCGDGYYSPLPGQDCFSCFDGIVCSEEKETYGCLTGIGWLVTIGCTYLGFALFFTAVLWNSSHVLVKLHREWKALRR